MTRQFTIIILCLTLMKVQGFSQALNQQASQLSVKDFFIPEKATKKAKATYHGRISKQIHYLSKGDQQYEILYANVFNGNPTSITTIDVFIDKNEVKMLNLTNTNIFETNKKTEFKTPVVLLKLPGADNTVSWDSQSFAGDIEKCTATFTTATYKGADYDAIKVIKVNSENSIQTIEYYLKGIGLYEVNFFDPSTNKETFVNGLVQIVN